MKADKYLESIGLENVIDEEFFNDDDKSWYKVQELMESYHQAKLDLLTIPIVVSMCCDKQELDKGMEIGFGKKLCKNCGEHIQQYYLQRGAMFTKCITIMKNYTKTKVLRITKIQYHTLTKMKSYNVDVSKFIRDAISEKIKREYKELIQKKEKKHCPF